MKISKICLCCGRSFDFRKKWEKNWDEIKYCSDRCRQAVKGSGKEQAQNFQNKILELLSQRARDATICPSEILTGSEKQDPELMEKVRQAARILVSQNKIQILQKGQIVEPATAKGPIRLRLKI